MKQIKKLSLSNVISKLTRNEMRYVMAGSGSTACGSCSSAYDCSSKCGDACQTSNAGAGASYCYFIKF